MPEMGKNESQNTNRKITSGMWINTYFIVIVQRMEGVDWHTCASLL